MTTASPPAPPRRVEKLCVFCGQAPDEKTKEHVIPAWLIEMTGRRGRTVDLGIDLYKGERRSFAFGQFTFPACNSCNNRHSGLEREAKAILTALLDGRSVSASDVSKLLDWFDKVRVGLWLGFRYLDKNYWNIQPNYFIDQRIGQFDRALSIYRDPRIDEQGVSFIGVSSPVFDHMPSCFTLRINNMAFINTSSVGLVSEPLGFPYPVEGASREPGRGTIVMFASGTEQVRLPLYVVSPPAGGRTLVQPMFRVRPLGEVSPYENSYVRGHSLDFDSGAGAIFFGDTAEKVQGPVGFPEGPIDWNAVTEYTLKTQRRLWSEGVRLDPDVAAHAGYQKVIADGQRKLEKLPERRRRFRRYSGPGR